MYKLDYITKKKDFKNPNLVQIQKKKNYTKENKEIQKYQL